MALQNLQLFHCHLWSQHYIVHVHIAAIVDLAVYKQQDLVEAEIILVTEAFDL